MCELSVTTWLTEFLTIFDLLKKLRKTVNAQI